MDRESELAVVRRAYAKQVMAAAGVVDRRVEAAFATVPREAFLGRGPWPVLRWGHGYVPTPSRNPVYLYADILVGIIPERNLNNGQPSLHAALLTAAAPRPREHAVHVGAGVGYYTAILAHLVGRRGRVTAIEYDVGLAERLAANFARQENVRVLADDGTQVDFDPADVIYVNAGATRPADRWLDRLTDGGRLILPLTAAGPPGDVAHGAVFRIERRGSDYHARWISPVGIFSCVGGRDPESEAALAAAFARPEGAQRVARLYRHGDVPEGRCWLKAPGWSLAYE